MPRDIPSQMQRTIVGTSVALGCTGLFGTFEPHADTGVIAAAWAAMFGALAAQAGHDITKDMALKIAGGVIVGIGGFMGGVKLANTYFAYTGIATPLAMLVNASANGAVTYIVGRAAARTFLSDDVVHTVEQVVGGIVGIVGTPDS